MAIDDLGNPAGLNAELERWVDSEAKLVGFGPDQPAMLRLLVFDPTSGRFGGSREILIEMIETRRVDGPISWSNARVEIGRATDDVGCVVNDFRAGFAVECSHVEILRPGLGPNDG